MQFVLKFVPENRYYVADDQESTANLAEALVYANQNEAEAEAKLVQNTWDLEPGTRVEVRPILRVGAPPAKFVQGGWSGDKFTFPG